jgi:hypothetical protein
MAIALEPKEDGDDSPSRTGARVVSILLLLLVLILLAVQVVGLVGLDKHVNVTTLILLGAAIILGYVTYSPDEVRAVLNRISSLRLGAFELAMQAATRVERVESRLAAQVDVANLKDEVQAWESRPTGNGTKREFRAVRKTLEHRLGFVRSKVLVLNDGLSSEEVVHEISETGLLEHDELLVTYGILDDIESELERLTEEVRNRYLEGAWRFAARFGSLVFERQVRRSMLKAGWFLTDFPQLRDHRPDFLAFRDGTWLLIAARVKPDATEETRARLLRQTLPVDARRVVVAPDTLCPFEVEDAFAAASIISLKEALKTAPATTS